MSIFGPSQNEIWLKLSQEIKAEFVKGGILKGPKIIVREKGWTLTLDTFAVHAGKVTVPFTRMRAPFLTKDSFRFKLENRNFFSGIVEFFGGKKLTTGFQELDSRFIINTTDEYKLKKLFANQTIRKLIADQKEILLEIKDNEDWPEKKFPSDVDELYFHAAGIVKEPEKLKVIFKLVAEVLNQMVEISSAFERDPNVTLK